MQIAVIDDDPDQLAWIAAVLQSEGHLSYGFSSGEAAIRALRSTTFDLLLVDWEIPGGINGIDLVKWIRRSLPEHIPVIFVTARVREQDIVEALQAGADDFLSKPVKINEMWARIHALLRRTSPHIDKQSFHPYLFDKQLQQASIRGQPVQLTPKEFELALLLFQNCGRLLSRQYILERIWLLNNPPNASLMSRSLDTHISRIRTQLKIKPENGYRLTSVYGQGYRLDTISN